MNKYSFPKFPGSKTWISSKHTFETEQTLPTRDYSVNGLFDGSPATLIMCSTRVAGDTVHNEKRKITGFIVQFSLGSGLYEHISYSPSNVNLLFSFDGYHGGCNAKCCCQVMSDSQYYKHDRIHCNICQ